MPREQVTDTFVDLIAEINEATLRQPTPVGSLSPQCRKIIVHMRKSRTGSISGDEAVNYYRIMALPRRIKDLREAGYRIRAERRKHPVTGQAYKRYHLIEDY